MDIIITEISGVLIIKNDIKIDTRGFLNKPFSEVDLLENNIQFKVAESFYSMSNKNVIRGMHFQKPPLAQGKIVTVIKGNITDVLLDLRKTSKSYSTYISLNMKERDGKSIFIPKGIAHGFLGRDKENIVLYFADSKYSMEHESGIRYDSFGYKWNVMNPLISERDRKFETFEKFISPFDK